MTSPAPELQTKIRNWQMGVFAVTWTTYFTYYLCRMNFSVAQPMILEDPEFAHWNEAMIGVIPSVYSAFYALGQFVNAQLGSRFGARRMMLIGVSVIAVVNIVFSSVSNYYLMLGLWALNGYCQSIGWPMIVQTMSNWFSVKRRGTMMGLVSTCYSWGNAGAWLLGGWLCSEFGWRSSFWIPGLTMIPIALAYLFFMRNTPEEVGLPHIRDDEEPEPESTEGAPAEEWTIWKVMRVTLTNRTLWLLGLSYFCFNAVRYAFMYWTPSYFKMYHGMDIKKGVFLAVAFPLIGSTGQIFAGWVSDRLLGGRRAPVCTVMLFILALLCLAFIPLEAGETLMATVVIAAAGFMIYGPDAILTGAAAIDSAHPKAAASAAGFIMAMGNLGAALYSGFGVGLILVLTDRNWTAVFISLAVLSLLAAGMAALLWNEKPKGT